MHLQHDVRSRRKKDGSPWSKPRGRQAGNVSANRAVGHAGLGVAAAFRRRDPGLRIDQPLGSRPAVERDDVVHDGPITGPHLDSFDPGVLVEPHRHHDPLVIDRPHGRDAERLRHLEDLVGLADVPAFEEGQRRGRLLRIALVRAGIGPAGDRVDFRLRQAPVVREVADRRIGVPRRHLPADDGPLHRRRPGTRVLVGQHRKRRRFARSMARLTILLEHWHHVFVERHGAGLRGGQGGQRDERCAKESSEHSNLRLSSLAEQYAVGWTRLRYLRRNGPSLPEIRKLHP